MAYFPAFLKLDTYKILIIGGGNIAYEKLDHLLDFTKDISLIAAEFSPEMMQLIDKNALLYERRRYEVGDIKEYSMIIVAIDDIALQKSIYEESKEYKCLCNAVDLPQYCDFIFPSYIKKGDLTVAVSTSGTSPAMAKHLRIYLQKMVPDSIVDFLQEMKNLRRTLPKGKERMQMLDAKAKKYIESWSK